MEIYHGTNKWRSYVRNDMEANFRREVWAAKGKTLVVGPGGRIPLAALGKSTFRGLEILLRRPLNILFH